MIKELTVLILGAGASIPYGFPSGEQLRDSICGMALGTNDYISFLDNLIDIDAHQYISFAEHFLKSNVASIDSFLSKRTEYVEIGKFSIAAILCQREQPMDAIKGASHLFSDVNSGGMTTFRLPDFSYDHWYHYIWNVLIDDVENIDAFKTNNIRFVTFNYDRSLEFFLFESIKNTFGVNDETAFSALNNIPILHVYGRLGEFHYRRRDGYRTYSTEINSASLRIAADGIRVIPEARKDAKEFKTAQKWCYEALNIGFLGFGFDRLNIERLNLLSTLELRKTDRKGAPYIFASTLGKTHREVGHNGRLIAPSLAWSPHEGNCTDTLRKTIILG